MRILISVFVLTLILPLAVLAADAIPQVTMKGMPFALAGPLPAMDSPAPVFVARDRELSPWTFAPGDGKIRLLVSVPSLDTPVCNLEVKKFFEQTSTLGDSLEVIVLSMDLPFAQQRWCVANECKQLLTLSDHAAGDFGGKYGVLIPTLRLLARAVFVLDDQGIIRYQELVPELSQEPDYAAALSSIHTLLGLPQQSGKPENPE